VTRKEGKRVSEDLICITCQLGKKKREIINNKLQKITIFFNLKYQLQNGCKIFTYLIGDVKCHPSLPIERCQHIQQNHDNMFIFQQIYN